MERVYDTLVEWEIWYDFSYSAACGKTRIVYKTRAEARAAKKNFKSQAFATNVQMFRSRTTYVNGEPVLTTYVKVR